MRWAPILVWLCWYAPTITAMGEEVENIGSSGYDVASEILTKSINFSVDPCEDFFEFTCGNWIADHPIPEDKSTYSQIEMLTDKVQEQMREIFESDETFGSQSINALKAIYKKCMDTDELNRIGARRLIEYIRTFGVWPILDGDEKWKEEDFDLTSLLIHVNLFRNGDVFIMTTFLNDLKNVSRVLFMFDQDSGSVGDPSRANLLNEEIHNKALEASEAVRKHLISKVELLQKDGDLPTNRTKIEKDVDELLDLERKMHKLTVAEEDRRDHSRYNLYHLSDMHKLMPLVDWSRFLLAIAPVASHQYFESDPEILIAEVDYMKRISKLLQSTDPRIITNYVFMRFSSKWEGEIGEKYEDIEQEVNKVMLGQQQKLPRWKYCTKHTMEQMEYATSAIYVKKAFDQASKNVTLELLENLLEIFRDILSTSDWMDDETRAAALDKANQMLPLIAYPDFILDDEKLDQYYDGLNVHDNDSYSEMLEKVGRWKLESYFKQLIRPVDRSEFRYGVTDLNSATVNAYYLFTANSIRVPAAFLQAPHFHHTFPRALNYGGLGTSIGHEITHGFDDQGRRFDAVGNLREWWHADSRKKFVDRAQCIISQYGNIEVPETGLNINGILTQGENIADNGGVKIAYRAYQNYLQKHGGEEKRVEGLEQFSNEQMFFLGYALVKCEHSTSDRLRIQLLSDIHAPPRYRVNQVLANQPEFAAAFGCKPGTAMNPAKRCAVW
ncbi:unnamed protein product [Cylicocyclus nassatus]|uniref:Uncharacterized protein n=1 Tax=Cylicocyclus nassatus TaxID=53992 RepID=A0AA36H9E0_CYLNA|nr:unnamed protein product [Cylicocyclus nassatus]